MNHLIVCTSDAVYVMCCLWADVNPGTLDNSTVFLPIQSNIKLSEVREVLWRFDKSKVIFVSFRQKFIVWNLRLKNLRKIISLLYIDFLKCETKLIFTHAQKPAGLVSQYLRLLQVGCLQLPMTSCEAEHSFSTVRRTKTALCSTMSTERLTALVLVNSDYDLKLKSQEVMLHFIRAHPRRLFSKLYDWKILFVSF